MSSAAMRMGARRVAAAARKPAQQPRRTMSDGPKRVLENQKKFQENPHLHGETKIESKLLSNTLPIVSVEEMCVRSLIVALTHHECGLVLDLSASITEFCAGDALDDIPSVCDERDRVFHIVLVLLLRRLPDFTFQFQTRRILCTYTRTVLVQTWSVLQLPAEAR